MFLNTLGLKIDMVRKWLETTKPIPNKMVATRKSKKLELSAFKIKNCERREYLKLFLADLPKVESHYCRRDTVKKYLVESFKTKTDVFEAYKKKCANDKEEPVSIFTFLTLFDEEKLSIYMPRKDQCDICVAYKTGQITKEMYQEHSTNEKRAKQEKEADKLAAEQKEQHTFTMDVQAVKMCPHLNASAIYYKQRLQVHNFSIFNLTSHQCTNYWWNESEGDLSASSFVTCIDISI